MEGSPGPPAAVLLPVASVGSTRMNRYRLLIGLAISILCVMVAIAMATPRRDMGTYSSGIPPAECHRPDGRIECPPGVSWPPIRAPR
jgi:hypothetical protein